MILEPEIPLAVMELGGGRRLSVAKDALCVEVRSGGVWARARAIPYDDIRALYRFQSTDWGGLGLLTTLWVVLLLALLIAAAALSWSGGVTIAGTVGLTLFFVVLGIVRARTAPARLLRIEAYSGPLQVPERSTTFYNSLAGQLKPGPPPTAVPSPPAPAAIPAEPAIASAEPAPEPQIDAALPTAPPNTEHPTPNTEP